MSHLTDEERADLASNLRWHFACHASEPDKSYAALGIENTVLRVEALIARHRAEAATEALRDAADEMSARLDTFPQRGRHTRARWAEQWLRDRSARIGGQS